MTQKTIIPIDQFLRQEVQRAKRLLDTLELGCHEYQTHKKLTNQLPISIRCVWKKCEGRMEVKDLENFSAWTCHQCGAIVNLDYPGG